jgi:hypothetical protein
MLWFRAYPAFTYRPFLYRPMPLRPIREMELDCLNLERDMGDTTFIIPQAVLNYGPIHNLGDRRANLPRHNRPISYWTCSGVLSAIRSTKLANLDPVRSLGLAADYQ